MLCKCPQLSPLQSRFAVSLCALALLALVYWSLSNPHFAYAAELEHDGTGAVRIRGEDHNWHRIQEGGSLHDGVGDGTQETVLATKAQEGDDELQASLSRRADEAEATNAIGENDAPNNLNIDAGETSLWRYTTDLLDQPQADRGTGLPGGLFNSSSDLKEVVHKELKRRNEERSSESSRGKRQSSSSKSVFISLNTCIQPAYNGTGTQTAAPPQLTLYVATDSNNKKPGPGSTGAQQEVAFDGGFANITIVANDDVWMSVHAPELPSDFSGGWNYEIAASTTEYYHRSDTDVPFMYLVDTDTTAALLVTEDLTNKENGTTEFAAWMNMTAPFVMFANNDNYTRTMGLSRSYCGLQINSQLQASQSDPFGSLSHVQTGMITRGIGDKPKEQFYITNLNGSTSYTGILARPGNSTASGAGVVGGGGTVWAPTPWTTKSDGNCQLMFNLSFCDEVAYAVPANPVTNPSRANLAALYDYQAAKIYENFTYTMQTVPCDTTNDSKYSLAKTCDDCRTAYKQWLCAVQLPRCEDYSIQDPDPKSEIGKYLRYQKRAMPAPFINQTTLPDSELSAVYHDLMPGAPTLDGTPAFSQTYNSTFASNSSRNTLIDASVMPGPYKEMLPCDDLCYSLVRNCPASLGFGCPAPGRGLERSYGKRDPSGALTCSYLGAVYYRNTATGLIPGMLVALGIALGVGLILG